MADKKEVTKVNKKTTVPTKKAGGIPKDVGVLPTDIKTVSKKAPASTKKAVAPKAEEERKPIPVIPYVPTTPGGLPETTSTAPQGGTTGPLTEIGVDPGQTSELRPPEVEETQRKAAGIFETEPKPVDPADPYTKPGFAKTALAYGTVLIPGVGMAGIQPLLAAQKKKKVQVAKDEELSGIFWKAMEGDPILAKEYTRMPSFRDMFQRKYGMSGDEILELDESISKEGIMSRAQFSQTMMKQGWEPEGGWKTEFGAVGAPPEQAESQVGRFKLMNDVIVDSTTGQPVRDLNRDKFNSILSNVQKFMPNLSEQDQFLTALGLSSKNNKVARAKPTVLAGGRGLYIEDRITGIGRIIKTGLGEKSNWQAEAYSSEGIPGIYDGVLLYDKSAENPQDTAVIIRFADTLMPDGTTATQELEEKMKILAAQKADAGTTKDAILKMISNFTGFFTQDNSPGMGVGTKEQQSQTVPPVRTVGAPPTGTPSRVAPAATTDIDIGKQNKFFGTSSKLIGD